MSDDCYNALVLDSGAIINQSQLQKQILIREPSKQATHIVSNFARITGDYSYLSRVDIQVIGLQYDLGVYV